MNNTVVEGRIRASSHDFATVVWPHLRDQLGGGNLVPVETVTDSGFARLLDTRGMTDVWQTTTTAIRALATRVQWGPTAYRTWSVRRSLPSGAETEYDKLLREGHWHRPSYVVQAYLEARGGPLLAAACISTTDLQRMLLNNWHSTPIPAPGGATFVAVKWADAEAHALKVIYA